MNAYQTKKAHALANPLGPEDSRHGTVNGYVNHLCRCEKCKAAWAEQNKVLRAVRRQRLASGQGYQPQHGLPTTYTNWGCRCEPCTKAHDAFRHKEDVHD